ncbi:MAG: alpha/beta hydrolase [Proteobacteria bacterium]|nr:MULTISPECIES: alpha/beta hydrolase [Pseudodesulfovibrio]MBU4191464.1 alpha/beta hydrolase [Pseudomonadota bacterium]MBU4245279.1 alpha/beta hydrolase [Pseudomonadota bacterium]MBU4379239.1 alpha/beta hydrolase [Pseudomonadota bacterium]MBU4476647.1 alpha/beta hydrolase [Pseudomonadota bacterium]MBU4514819.1 alpha/beta hydrolase [Pseudomonadota bacterium]
MTTLLKIVAVLAAAYVCLTVWVYLSQRRLLYQPTRTVTATPADIGLAYEDVRLVNALGTELHGWWLPHPQARFTLLFCHGNGGNVSHRLHSLRLFHDLGLSVLIFDYSGYGRSLGEPSEVATRADARAAWDWLAQRGIDPGSVILFGRSLGGAVAARLAADVVADVAAEGTPVAGLILESTFTSVPDMGARLYPWLPVRLLVRDRYDSTRALAGLQTPALFIHSPDDEIVPHALGLALYDGYQGPKSFLALTGGHNDGFLLSGQDYVAGLVRFLAGLQVRAPGPGAENPA